MHARQTDPSVNRELFAFGRMNLGAPRYRSRQAETSHELGGRSGGLYGIARGGRAGHPEGREAGHRHVPGIRISTGGGRALRQWAGTSTTSTAEVDYTGVLDKQDITKVTWDQRSWQIWSLLICAERG